MATFRCDDIEGLTLSMEEVAEIPENVVYEILDAQGKVVAKAHRESIRRHGLRKTGMLESSIKHIRKMRLGTRYVLVYPTGTHHEYTGVEKTGVYSRSKSNRTYTYGGGSKKASNSDVGFVHEFGAPYRNIKATGWMREANEMSAEATTRAGFEVYDKWLKSKNL